MYVDMNEARGSAWGPVRRILFSANEIGFPQTGLQGNNTFEYFDVDYQLCLEQGWNHDAQRDIFSGKNTTAKANSCRGVLHINEMNRQTTFKAWHVHCDRKYRVEW